MTIEVLNPTHEDDGRAFNLAPRVTSLDGAVVAVVSNGKKGTIPFFDAMENALKANHGVAEVVRITKGNYSTPCEADRLNDAARWQALIAGVGD